MKDRAFLLPHLALFLVQLLYAANFTVSKTIMPDYISPIGIIFLRASFGALMFWLLHLFFIKAKEVVRADIPLLLTCSVFGIAINQMSFYYGLNLTTPINASIIMLIVPIIAFAGGVLFLKEKFTLLNVIGIIIGCTGAFILIGYGQKLEMGQRGIEGNLFVLLNAFSYSIYLIIVRPLVKKYHPIVIMKWVFTFGFIFTVPFTYPEIAKVDWSTIPSGIWWSIAYVLIGSTFLTYLLNGFALQKLTTRVVGAYIYLQPILAAVVALLAGQDTLTTIKVLSGVLIFMGVFFASQRKQVSVSKE